MTASGHSRRSSYVCPMSAHPLTAATFAARASVAISSSALTRMRLNWRVHNIGNLRVALNALVRVFRMRL
jgi:hypothetical protein